MVARRAWLTATLCVLVTALGGSAGYGAARWLPSGESLPGTWVGERVQPRDERLADWLERRRVALEEEEAWVHGEGQWFRTTWGELGISLDVAATLDAARAHARAGSLGARLRRAVSARRGLERVPLVYGFHAARAEATLARLAPSVRREPVDARLDLDAHRRIDDVPGAELDVAASVRTVERGERRDLPVFELAFREVPARVSRAMLLDLDPSRVLGSFETDFGGTGEGRAVNIARAARALDGVVLAPGQELSFNQVVGPRTFERGFVLAPVIIDDELDSGVGGGICQVASTLHVAAVYGGLEIVRRRSHSRPSSYTRPGLDATVVYGEVDLVIRNPWPMAILVRAFRPQPTRLRVELLGHQHDLRFEYSWVVTRTSDFYRRITTKPWLGDRAVRRQRGRRGMDVHSRLVVIHSDGRREERRWFSSYRPVPEVFWVGPENDGAGLPELPPGARHVEVDGVNQAGGTFLGQAPRGSGGDSLGS